METRIGLEIHVYLNMEKSRAKLFCNCPVDYQDSIPNINICPVCTGMPGSKPMLPNKEAMEKVIAIASMLKCRLNRQLIFQRKHYSWPDLPNGYQKTISGPSATPVGINGNLNGIHIIEVHLEEDPAKWDPETGYVNYNRSGLPLAEIVTSPDLHSPEQAREWLRNLVVLLSYIKAVPRNTAIKADVNISIENHPRVEVKNVNSFRSICTAIEHEVARQLKELEEKKELKQETRGFDELTGHTFHMRFKETAEDYRFIPEPDLQIINLKEQTIRNITKNLPETPSEKITDYKKKYKLSDIQAKTLASDLLLATIFEKVAKEVHPILAANWLTTDFLKLFKEQSPEDFHIDVSQLSRILKMLEQNKITDKMTKDMIRKLLWERMDIEDYEKKYGTAKIVDSSLLEPICREVINNNPQAVKDYKSGKEKAFNNLLGLVMAATKGKADFKEASKIIKKLLS